MKHVSVTTLNEQRGVSKLGVVTLLLVITAFLTVGLKVGPLYVDHNLIAGICQELIDNGEAANMSVTDIRNRVSNTLRINNVIGFDLNSITKRMENNAAIISIDYERRVELIGNLDVVAKFENELR